MVHVIAVVQKRFFEQGCFFIGVHTTQHNLSVSFLKHLSVAVTNLFGGRLHLSVVVTSLLGSHLPLSLWAIIHMLVQDHLQVTLFPCGSHD